MPTHPPQDPAPPRPAIAFRYGHVTFGHGEPDHAHVVQENSNVCLSEEGGIRTLIVALQYALDGLPKAPRVRRCFNCHEAGRFVCGDCVRMVLYTAAPLVLVEIAAWLLRR